MHARDEAAAVRALKEAPAEEREDVIKKFCNPQKPRYIAG